MKIVSFKIASTVLAATISSLIVYAFSFAGHSTKHSIENAMTYTGNMVQDIEQKLIVEKRTEKRKDKLNWLKPYLDNKRLLQHPDKILLGAFDNEMTESFESIASLEDSLKTTFPLISIYAAWGNKPDEKFPADQVKNIIALGSVPVITWEPWLSDFDEEQYPGGNKPENPDKSGLRNIANGVYDNYILQWATAARKINKPLFLRFGHEMNDGYRYPWGPQNNSSQDFIAAWQHVHDLFARERVNNIIWIWSPHPSYEFRDFYPGDAYVDYVGVGALNYGTVATWSKWWAFRDILGKNYSQLAAYNKPVMITEFGSLASGGNRTKWYADALDSLPQRYPLVKAILFFHFSEDNTTTSQTLNWYIKNDHSVITTVIREFNTWK